VPFEAPADALLLIGPESGLSEAERELARAHRVPLARLGEGVVHPTMMRQVEAPSLDREIVRLAVPALGVIAFPGVEIYVASKHAVIGLTKSAALEFGKQGIRVNAILPAVIDTDMYHGFAGEKPEFRAQMTALHPIGRIGKSEEIADAAIWLSSSKSSFVTGHSLLVDGGFTAQ